MKLVTKSVLLVLATALAIFFTTHHRVYGNCKNTIEGRECSLIKWEGNK